LDLVGRKLPREGGRAMRAFLKEVGEFTEKHAGNDGMRPFAAPLRDSVKALEAATMWLMQNGMKNPDNAGAAATEYMHLMGLAAIGYMWGLMAEKAHEALAGNGVQEREFYQN